MDVISLNEAATANSRIESFNANPDSTSGVVTVPKTIAAGETVTIPTGRVAVLPNVQVDGTLNVLGEVFIPSGSVTSQVVPRVTSTDNAIVRFDGTGGAVKDSKVVVNDSGHIRANASESGEHAFKPNTTSEYVRVSATASDYFSLPSYTSTSLMQYGSTASGNYIGSIPMANLGGMWNQNSSTMLIGTNSYAPIIFASSSIEKMRIDLAGNVLVTGGGGLGYGAGSGGTVTQLTSKSTAVTLNKPTGTIIMNNAALAAGASVSFIVSNNIVSATGSIVDTAIVSIYSGIAGYSNYRVQSTVINGGFVVTLTNQTGISLSEASILKFDVFKGAVA